MKRLNNYLLLHYPQLWNLRLVWVVPAIAIVHLIFYICGYASFKFGGQIHYNGSISDHAMGESMGFSVLISILIFILWLVFYLRNNPFKSFYPLSRLYFAIEFTLIMLIFAGGSTFYNTYAKGYWQSVRNKTSQIDVVAEANTLNMAYALIPVAREHYRVHACCDSLDYIDSLRTLRSALWERDHPGDNNYYNDPNKFRRRNGRYMEMVAVKPEAPKIKIPPSAVFRDVDTAITLFQKRQRDFDFNYMNFCHQYYSDLDTMKGIASAHQISARLQQIMSANDKKAVKDILLKFDKMCMDYEINKDVNVMEYNSKVFRHADHSVDEFICLNSYGYTYNDNDEESNAYAGGTTMKNYLAFDEVSKSLSHIQHARNLGFDFDFFMIIFYLSFSMAILLYSYRLSARKPWFIAMVGMGVLVILTAILAAMVNIIHGFGYIWLLLTVLFYVFHFVFRASVRRTLAGVNLVWLTWMLPALGVLIIECIKSGMIYDSSSQRYPSSYYWIQDHYSTIMFAYILGAFIYTITLLSMLYRRWQAMPEE